MAERVRRQQHIAISGRGTAITAADFFVQICENVGPSQAPPRAFSKGPEPSRVSSAPLLQQQTITFYFVRPFKEFKTLRVAHPKGSPEANLRGLGFIWKC